MVAYVSELWKSRTLRSSSGWRRLAWAARYNREGFSASLVTPSATICFSSPSCIHEKENKISLIWMHRYVGKTKNLGPIKSMNFIQNFSLQLGWAFPSGYDGQNRKSVFFRNIKHKELLLSLQLGLAPPPFWLRSLLIGCLPPLIDQSQPSISVCTSNFPRIRNLALSAHWLDFIFFYPKVAWNELLIIDLNLDCFCLPFVKIKVTKNLFQFTQTSNQVNHFHTKCKSWDIDKLKLPFLLV